MISSVSRRISVMAMALAACAVLLPASPAWAYNTVGWYGPVSTCANNGSASHIKSEFLRFDSCLAWDGQYVQAYTNVASNEGTRTVTANTKIWRPNAGDLTTWSSGVTNTIASNTKRSYFGAIHYACYNKYPETRVFYNGENTVTTGYTSIC